MLHALADFTSAISLFPPHDWTLGGVVLASTGALIGSAYLLAGHLSARRPHR